MGEFVFDPRVWILPPYWRCPFCGAEREYGVLMIGGNSYRRRCRACMESEGLPAARRSESGRLSRSERGLEHHEVAAPAGRRRSPCRSVLARTVRAAGHALQDAAPDLSGLRDSSRGVISRSVCRRVEANLRTLFARSNLRVQPPGAQESV